MKRRDRRKEEKPRKRARKVRDCTRNGTVHLTSDPLESLDDEKKGQFLKMWNEIEFDVLEVVDNSSIGEQGGTERHQMLKIYKKVYKILSDDPLEANLHDPYSFKTTWALKFRVEQLFKTIASRIMISLHNTVSNSREEIFCSFVKEWNRMLKLIQKVCFGFRGISRIVSLERQDGDIRDVNTYLFDKAMNSIYSVFGSSDLVKLLAQGFESFFISWISRTNGEDIEDLDAICSVSSILNSCGILKNQVRPKVLISVEEESGKLSSHRDMDVDEYLKYIEANFSYIQRLKEISHKILGEVDAKELVNSSVDIIVRNIDVSKSKQVIFKIIESEETEALGNLYHLLKSRASDGVLRELYKEYVRLAGQEFVSKAESEISATEDSMMFEKLLLRNFMVPVVKLAGHTHSMNEKSFSSDRGMMAASRSGMFEFINCTFRASKSSIPLQLSSARLFSHYCSNIVRTERLSELHSVMLDILEVIANKDVFLQDYSRRLATRLLRGSMLHSSREDESAFVNSLKSACPMSLSEEVHNLEVMLKDDVLNGDLNDQFHRQSSCPLRTTVRVLTDGKWPTCIDHRFDSFHPDPSFLECMDRFNELFKSLHPQRILRWSHTHAKGELLAYTQNGVKIISGNTVQLSMLLSFNNTDSMSVKDLAQNFSLDVPVVIFVAQTLLEKNILRTEDEIVTENSTISYNLHFHSKHTVIALSSGVERTYLARSEADDETIEKSRKVEVDAAIVRCMKERKRMKIQELVSVVSIALSGRFLPAPRLIKSRMEALMEKEYIFRSNEDMDLVIYK